MTADIMGLNAMRKWIATIVTNKKRSSRSPSRLTVMLLQNAPFKASSVACARGLSFALAARELCRYLWDSDSLGLAFAEAVGIVCTLSLRDSTLFFGPSLRLIYPTFYERTREKGKKREKENRSGTDSSFFPFSPAALVALIEML